jgi:hypothetical protein
MAGSRKTRADAGDEAVVRAVRVRRLDAVDVRNDRRSSDMDREVFVDGKGVWGRVKAEVVVPKIASRAILRKDFMVSV